MENNTKREYEGEALKHNKSNTNPLKKGFVWRPVPTILSTTLCFLISGVIFIIIGAILLYLATNIRQFTIRYDNNSECDTFIDNTNNKTCLLEITLDDDFNPPVMVYYQLENFYQDHRRYIKSKSVDQLKGEILTASQIKDDCEPIIHMQDVGIYKSIGNVTLNASDVANPCGLIAKSLFNDTYMLIQNETPIYINETDIAWDSDKKNRYVMPENGTAIQWTNVTDEHFMVWMRPAGLPDFRKLWGRINHKLTAGKYKLNITNNYPVASFGGKKSFVLSTVNALGGKNNFLGIAYLVVGCICLIMALLFWVGYRNYNTDKKLN